VRPIDQEVDQQFK